jgi:hypothetical protein
MFAGLALLSLDFDRRLLLNRKRKLQMWRCWIVRCSDQCAES